jgi:nucleotide-binding universal stress UspA family protein
MAQVQLISLTDFSETSKNAFRYAHGLSFDLGASLTLVHYYEHINTTGHFKSMKNIMQEDAEREMKELIAEARETMNVGDEVLCKVLEGNVITNLQRLKASRDYLVVMGSRGATNKLATVFGSTAKSLVNRVDLPTLIVPPHYSYRKPQTIVVANDGMMTEANLKYVDMVATKLGAHLYFLHVGDLEIDQKLIDKYSIYLETCTYSFHNIAAGDIVLGINRFANNVQAELVIMAKNKRNFLQSIFVTSQTNEELFHSMTPLLVLHRGQQNR